VEKVRLVSSGTEAAMTAVRLARGATGRTKILKFAGCYHGHLDALLVAAGSGVATLGIPGSAGVTPGAVADTVVVPFNDIPAVDAAFLEHEFAAVLVEPIAANMGLVPAAPGFLDYLRNRCTGVGALLVFDEVITGFRVGIAGAQGRFGITPDLSIFGKIVGGGLPLAAVGGRAEIMDHLAPLGPVYQAGTLSGNPLATAAGLAALAQLDQGSYDELERKAELLAVSLHRGFTEAGLASQVTRAATLTGLFFSSTAITNYEQAQLADHSRYAKFFHGMLDRGVYFAPSGYETTFVSLAHTDENIAHTAALAAEVAATL
jgi:glutamate-1-semialdehyde 2,1-aminomutase